jgi:hypothetical protein
MPLAGSMPWMEEAIRQVTPGAGGDPKRATGFVHRILDHQTVGSEHYDEYLENARQIERAAHPDLDEDAINRLVEKVGAEHNETLPKTLTAPLGADSNGPLSKSEVHELIDLDSKHYRLTNRDLRKFDALKSSPDTREEAYKFLAEHGTNIEAKAAAYVQAAAALADAAKELKQAAVAHKDAAKASAEPPREPRPRNTNVHN